MRPWLPSSEQRRPDPEPVKTDDRTAIAVGMALWVVAFAVLLLFSEVLLAHDNGWMLWTCGAGIALGIAGLIYTQVRRRRAP